jgi:ankyrin repeat protein
MGTLLKFSNNRMIATCLDKQETIPIVDAISNNKFDDFIQLLGENDEERRENAMRNLQNPNENGRITPFMLACFYGCDRMLEYMLNLGNIDINHKDATGLSCLQHAAHLNHDYFIWQNAPNILEGGRRCVKLLLSSPRIDVNAAIYNHSLMDSSTFIISMTVYSDAHLPVLRMLLSHKDIYIPEDILMTSIIYGQWLNFHSLVRYADVNYVNHLGKSVLRTTIDRRNTNLALVAVRQLIDRDVCIHSMDAEGHTAITVTQNQKYLVHALLTHAQI